MSKELLSCVNAFVTKAGMSLMEAELTVAASSNPWKTLKRAKKCRPV